jgi:hypothetical protein
MKITPHRTAKVRGVMLVEALVYMLLIIFVIGMAAAVFFEALRHTREVSGFAEDVARTLRAGERWREDVRHSTGPIERLNTAEGFEWHIPGEPGPVIYRLAEDALSRYESEETAATLLTGVKWSRMEMDEGGQVVSWRWELELRRRNERVRTPALFTFQAAPFGTNSQ